MQYTYDGELHKIVRITGPKHNMLGLGLDNIKKNYDIEVVDLDYKGNANLSPSEVKSQVLQGILEINKELGTQYQINKIAFFSSDTKSDTIYKELTKEIIRRLHLGC